MNRSQFEHAIRAAGAILGADELLVIGSQAIHASIDMVIPEAERSIEVDVAALDDADGSLADLIDGSIGELSVFQETYGYYAQGVTPQTAVLPAGWRKRLVSFRTPATNGVTALCLEQAAATFPLKVALREATVLKCSTQKEVPMAKYIPPSLDWVRKQVELYESSGGTEGNTLLDTGLPCVLVTHKGNKTGAVRKIPLMRVKVDEGYVLVGSMGGQPKNPVWVYNLRANPDVEIRDGTEVFEMRAREVTDDAERKRLWDESVAAFPNYADYQAKTTRRIPVFLAEPT